MASVYEPDLMAAWAARMQQAPQAPASSPFRYQWKDPYGSPNAGKSVDGVAYASRNIDRENVMASQGAGAAPGGADWGQRMAQQQQMNAMGAQQQMGAGQAAFMRNTPTPGSNASMQWLQRQGGQGGGAPGQGQGMQWLQQQQRPQGFGQPMGQGQPMGGGWGMR